MATIQIRDIPDDAYEVMRRRARTTGRSIQAYMRDLVIESASRPTPEEALAAMEAVRDSNQSPGATHDSVLSALAADRR